MANCLHLPPIFPSAATTRDTTMAEAAVPKPKARHAIDEDSPLLRQTLRSLTRDARGVPDLGRLRALLLDSAALSGRSRTAIMLDAALTRGGRAFACDFVRAWLRARVPWLRGVWAAWRASWRTPAETV